MYKPRGSRQARVVHREPPERRWFLDGTCLYICSCAMLRFMVEIDTEHCIFSSDSVPVSRSQKPCESISVIFSWSWPCRSQVMAGSSPGAAVRRPPAHTCLMLHRAGHVHARVHQRLYDWQMDLGGLFSKIGRVHHLGYVNGEWRLLNVE
jgi:hypothetical protein